MTGNLLALETSPYLLQHKDNPVHWRPWGPAALAEAKAANKPILLSVGYAACHWCHVMAHECFEDAEVAAVMNELFVNIKVDREERPDIDQIYMSALHLLGEHGGWPLTMFLTPAADPFWGGTYFPKEPRYGRPGFIQVLSEVARIFREEPDKIEHNRAALRERLAAQASAEPAGSLSPDLVEAAAERLLSFMDPAHGGTQGAPKFPQTGLLELLWRAGERRGETAYGEAVMLALQGMAQGGIYDHLGGGYARYSVDAQWLVPHFEKMLYDNALLIDLMSLAWPAGRSGLLRQRVEETVGWLVREMRQAGGAFASSLDADSEGEEGKFYLWSADQVRALLGEAYDLFATYYDVTPEGNFEGRTILNRLRHPQLAEPELEARLARARAILFAARESRVRPGLDDKILADWNGLAIHALARAGFVFDRPDWIDLAGQTFAFVAREMSDGDRLWHSWRAGRAGQRGLLADYAAMVRAALALHEVAGDGAALKLARSWSATLDRHFAAPSDAYHMSADDADDLILRPLTGIDDATPNGNALQAANLIRLWHLTGEEAYRARADAIFSAFAGEVRRSVLGFASLLNAYDLAVRAVDVVLVGPRDESMHAVLRSAAASSLLVIEVKDGGSLPPGHAAHGKPAVDGKGTAYVCARGTCSLPFTEASSLSTHLAGLSEA